MKNVRSSYSVLYSYILRSSDVMCNEINSWEDEGGQCGVFPRRPTYFGTQKIVKSKLTGRKFRVIAHYMSNVNGKEIKYYRMSDVDDGTVFEMPADRVEDVEEKDDGNGKTRRY